MSGQKALPGRKDRPGGGLQGVEKVEAQEAVPPARVLGAEPLNLVPQHFSREPAKRCSRVSAANQGVFDSLKFA